MVQTLSYVIQYNHVPGVHAQCTSKNEPLYLRINLRFGYYFHSLRRWEATMESQNKKPTIHHGLLGTQESDNTILYVQLDDKLFLGNDDNLITAIAHNVQEAARLVEVGFGYATERQQ